MLHVKFPTKTYDNIDRLQVNSDKTLRIALDISTSA